MFFHFSSTDTEGLFKAFTAEAITNADPGTFSSMVALFALSSVVNQQINSVYSPKNSRLFSLFTRVIGPCGGCKSEPIQLISIYWTFKSFHFIVHLIIVRFVMSYTLPLTYELQEKQLDVVKVYKAVDTVIQSLKECREQVDTQHAKWFKEVVDFAKTINVVPCVKRIAGQQTL